MPSRKNKKVVVLSIEDNSENTINKVLKAIKLASHNLYIAITQERDPTEVELLLLFRLLNKFIKELESNPSLKKGDTSFVIDIIFSALDQLPSKYKKLVQDQNVCSIFYDIANFVLYLSSNSFPINLNRRVVNEAIELTKEFLSLVTYPSEKGDLLLKKWRSESSDEETNLLRAKPIKFDRNSKHFQFFSYYNDLKYIRKSIELLDLAVDNNDISGKHARYLFISVIAKIGENLGHRMLSPRMIKFLSSDISVDNLAQIRNRILHREQDLNNQLVKVIESSDETFRDIRGVLLDIEISLRSALSHMELSTRPQILIAEEDISQKLERFLRNVEEPTTSSIQRFYNTEYVKISSDLETSCQSRESFACFYPQLSVLIGLNPDFAGIDAKIIALIRLGNREEYNKYIYIIKDAFEKYCQLNGRHLKQEKGITFKQVREEFKKLLKDNKIDDSKLNVFITPEDTADLSDIQKDTLILGALKRYQSCIVDILGDLRSVNTEYIFDPSGDMRSVDTIMDGNALSEMITINGRQGSLFDAIPIPLMYSIDSEHNIKLRYKSVSNKYTGKVVLSNDLGNANISVRYAALCKNFFPPNHPYSMVMIFLTNEEYKLIFNEEYEGAFKRDYSNYLLSKEELRKIHDILIKEDMEARMDRQLAFQQMLKVLEQNDNLLLESELLISFVEKLNAAISDQKLSCFLKEDFKLFRNGLAHNGEIENFTGSRITKHKSVLRYLLVVSRMLKDKIIPALESAVSSPLIPDPSSELLKLNLDLRGILNAMRKKKAAEADVFLREQLDLQIEAYQALYSQLGMRIVNVKGDGNCFFYAVEEQLRLMNNDEVVMNYQQIREFAVNYIRDHRQEFEGFLINETIEEYLDRMLQNREWADHNIIQALSMELKINIVVISNNHIETPQVIGSSEFLSTIYLGHIVELHYVSLERIDDVNSNQSFHELDSLVKQGLQKISDGSKSVGIVDVDSSTLEMIAKIEAVIGKEALLEIVGWHKYVSAALSNNSLRNSANKVISIIADLVKSLEEKLDFSSLYESIDIDNQVTIIITQLEGWFDLVESANEYIGFPPRYPGFDPDYDFSAGGSGGDGSGGNVGLGNGYNPDMVTIMGQNTTTHEL